MVGRVRSLARAAIESAWRLKRAFGRRQLLKVAFPLQLATASEPVVSIIVPARDRSLYTFNCLLAISQHAGNDVPFEVIVVDDGSIDDTATMLDHVSGVRVVTNRRSLGFADACNSGARTARGRYLLFLNNDTLVTNSWLQPLVSALETNPTIGAAGSMLLYTDERVSEAGAIIWSDANGWNYGRGLLPDDPVLRDARVVDYCSAASLIVRKALFEEVGGFDLRFSPAYYEDVDLCFSLRTRGYNTLFVPTSRAYHFEGVTTGTGSSRSASALQARNRQVFANKWQCALQDQMPPGLENVLRASGRERG